MVCSAAADENPKFNVQLLQQVVPLSRLACSNRPAGARDDISDGLDSNYADAQQWTWGTGFGLQKDSDAVAFKNLGPIYKY